MNHYIREKGYIKLHVNCCGLFISTENPSFTWWLGNWPWRWNLSIRTGRDKESLFCKRTVKLLPALHSASNKIKMELTHSSQGMITTFKYNANSTAQVGTGACDFVVKTGKNMHIEYIQKNDSWFNTHLSETKKDLFQLCPSWIGTPWIQEGWNDRSYNGTISLHYICLLTLIMS